MTTPTVARIKDYLAVAIDSFKSDPADSDFQRGYLAAMQETFAVHFLTAEERAAMRQTRQ